MFSFISHFQTYARPSMTSVGNMTYDVIDSIPLVVLCVLFMGCAIFLHLMPKAKTYQYLPTTSPHSHFSHRSRNPKNLSISLPDHLPVPSSSYSFPLLSMGKPFSPRSAGFRTAIQLSKVLQLNPSSTPVSPRSPRGGSRSRGYRRGSKRLLGMRGSGLGTLFEVEEEKEEQV